MSKANRWPLTSDEYRAFRIESPEEFKRLHTQEWQDQPTPEVQSFSVSPDGRSVTLRFDRALDRRELHALSNLRLKS